MIWPRLKAKWSEDRTAVLLSDGQRVQRVRATLRNPRDRGRIMLAVNVHLRGSPEQADELIVQLLEGKQVAESDPSFLETMQLVFAGIGGTPRKGKPRMNRSAHAMRYALEAAHA